MASNRVQAYTTGDDVGEDDSKAPQFMNMAEPEAARSASRNKTVIILLVVCTLISCGAIGIALAAFLTKSKISEAHVQQLEDAVASLRSTVTLLTQEHQSMQAELVSVQTQLANTGTSRTTTESDEPTEAATETMDAEDVTPPQTPASDVDAGNVGEVNNRPTQEEGSIATELETLQSAHSQLVNRIGALEGKSRTYAMSIGDLVGEVSRTASQSTALSTTMAALSTSVHTMRTEMNALQTPTKAYSSCNEALTNSSVSSGTFRITVLGQDITVACVQDVDGSWAVIQRRLDGSVSFDRNWTEYRNGFGDVQPTDTEFWLGLQNMHVLTATVRSVLKVVLGHSPTQIEKEVLYIHFVVASQVMDYAVLLSGGGDIGSPFLAHNGAPFSTHDEDNDGLPTENCATKGSGGWWYKNCSTANLNGQYIGNSNPESGRLGGIEWGTQWEGPFYSYAEMRVQW